ncbi:PorV/PorQ family protein [Agriterribacter sp.]|uniref:putative type IX sorting system protein PorV2 n=1 Tax=Agriterribacter sp. TaxID=2821509 RepID=UPI002C814EF7|nr:PorV/PorQ family protein [Agriterribacter sp.]HRO47781.1 PorV/PorQ family protein [Agriterribacter sp.]HRQ17986.1 PorV/PorQ family protein [Agriterribacter sp.]
MKKVLLRIVLIVLLSSSMHAYAQFRKYSNEFLNIGAGARGLGMGGAQVASVSDGNAGYWNPAGLVHIKDNPVVNFMHAEYFSGIGKYDYGSVAIPLSDKKRTIALSLLRFGVDDIPNTLYLVEPDGSINYNNIRSFSSADYAFLFSYAQSLKQKGNRLFSFGVNAKVIHRNVGTFAKAWGFGLDAGVQMQTKRWKLGIAARDVTTTFNAWSFSFTEEEKEVLYLTDNEIPVKSTELTAPRLVLGAAYDFALGKNFNLLAEANADLTFDGKRNVIVSADPVSIDPRLGIELGYKDLIFVRSGIYNFQRALADGDTLNQKKVWIYQPGLGAGFKLKHIAIDYAFTNLANQSNPLYTHIFSIRLDLVKKEKTKSVKTK